VETRIPALLLLMKSLCMPGSDSRLAAQAGTLADSVYACDLLSNADVQNYRATGKKPRGLLVAYRGTRTLTVQVDMDLGQLPESALPLAVGLAKIALAAPGRDPATRSPCRRPGQ
jgi:hypothetical protein